MAIGSGGTHAATVMRVGWRRDLSPDDAVRLAARALWEAADADSATGGPDALRGIYPVVATITEAGWSRVPDAVLAALYQQIAGEVGGR